MDTGSALENHMYISMYRYIDLIQVNYYACRVPVCCNHESDTCVLSLFDHAPSCSFAPMLTSTYTYQTTGLYHMIEHDHACTIIIVVVLVLQL